MRKPLGLIPEASTEIALTIHNCRLSAAGFPQTRSHKASAE